VQAPLPFDPATLTYPWLHADSRVDDLQRALAERVSRTLNEPRRPVFDAVRRLAHERAGLPLPAAGVSTPVRARATVPYLNEP
jgi:hypothetical protein